jgi:thioredoxin-related protein
MNAGRLILTITAALILAGCGGGGDTDRGGETNTWMSFDAGMEMARNLDKPVVIDFYTSWCRWCKVMEKETFSDEGVASYLDEHFISIRLDAEQKTGDLKYGGRTYSPAQLARKFRVRGYPAIAYLDSSGELVFIDMGFKKPKQFMVNLRYMTSGCPEKGVSIEEYKQRGGSCG